MLKLLQAKAEYERSLIPPPPPDLSNLPAPQAGPQTLFFNSPASIVIYGGAAGSGKSGGLLLAAAKYREVPDYGAVIFRRTCPQITNEGGLWDTSFQLYPPFKASPRVGDLEWRFPGGGTVRFAHMQHEKNRLDWQGSQIAFIGFDELTHFSEAMFWYMLSRNRSTCGVEPHVRATTNPDSDSWVGDLISWWLDEEGYPIPERSGVIRWFVRDKGELVWSDAKEELLGKYPDNDELRPKSLTFIAAKIDDNKILLDADPNYKANLLALPYVDQMRLLFGNWKVRDRSGAVFTEEWWRHWGDLLPSFTRTAISLHSGFKKSATSAHTAIQFWGKTTADTYYLIHQVRGLMSFVDAKLAILKLVSDMQQLGITTDELLVEEQSNGEAIVDSLLSECPVPATRTSFKGDTSISRAQAVSTLVASGSVFLPPKPQEWVKGLENEIANFPNAKTEDQVGALSQALTYLALRDPADKPYKSFNRVKNGFAGADAVAFGYSSQEDLHVAFDFNWHPACAVVAHVRNQGEVHFVREFYLLNSDTFRLAEAVFGWVAQTKHQGQLYLYGDASGNQRHSDAKETNWAIVWSAVKAMGLKGRAHRRYGKSNPGVRDRVLSVNHLMREERLFICLDTCPELVKDFEQMKWKGDQLDKSDPMRSHLSDGAGYLIHTLFSYKKATSKGGVAVNRSIVGLV